MNAKSLLILAILLFPIPSVASAQSHVVVLKNGNVLKGIVNDEKIRVEVRTTGASLIVLQSDEVDFICNSMFEAYQLVQASSDPNSVDAQKEVFFWCMRHRLYEQARSQIDLLQLMPIKASDLDYLNRQLNVAFAQKNRQANSKRLPLAAGEELAHPNVGDNPNGEVRQVNFEQDLKILPLPKNLANQQLLAPMPDTVPKEPELHVASAREIEELSRSFSGKSNSQYKRHVEPQLIRNCYLGGCHNAQQKKMPLLSFGRGVPISKRLSQRNLYSIIQYVDLEHPLESPLYQFAQTAHAGMEEPAYKAGRNQLRILKEWLLSIATPEAQRHHLAQQRKMAQEQNAMENRLPGENVIQQVGAALTDSSVPAVPNLTPRGNVFVPRDPFDPEIFNRKYRKR